MLLHVSLVKSLTGGTQDSSAVEAFVNLKQAKPTLHLLTNYKF